MFSGVLPFPGLDDLNADILVNRENVANVAEKIEISAPKVTSDIYALFLKMLPKMLPNLKITL